MTQDEYLKLLKKSKVSMTSADFRKKIKSSRRSIYDLLARMRKNGLLRFYRTGKYKEYHYYLFESQLKNKWRKNHEA